MTAMAERKTIWSVGTREVVFMAIGAALYAVFSVATNLLQIPGAANVSVRPGVVIPMFFGLVFGPWVGFFSGFVGNLLGDAISGYGFFFWWDLGNGLMGFIPGLALLSVKAYRTTPQFILAEVYVIIGVVVGMGLAALSEMWVSGADLNAVIYANFVPAALTNLVNGLILTPILLAAYNAVRGGSGR